MKKILINQEDRERIEQAVIRAEEKTSGEVATALIQESSTYAFYELLFALAGGIAFYFGSLFFFSSITLWLEGLFWDFKPVYVTLFMGISVFAVVGILYLLANISGVDRLIVPKAVLDKEVNRRAALHFMEAGLFDTRDRTGILIFISHREKRVQILADRGINEQVEEGCWQQILDDLVGGIKEGLLADSLICAVDACGDILAEHCPRKDDDTNELGDGITILEE